MMIVLYPSTINMKRILTIDNDDDLISLRMNDTISLQKMIH